MTASTGNPWHDAVLQECMSIEAAYQAADPRATLRALIDWHRQDAAAIDDDINRTNATLADHYLKLTAGATAAGTAEQCLRCGGNGIRLGSPFSEVCDQCLGSGVANPDRNGGSE